MHFHDFWPVALIVLLLINVGMDVAAYRDRRHHDHLTPDTPRASRG